MPLADCSSHPLLLTEPALAPTGVRAQLAQLVFEAYGLPAFSTVAAAPAAFYHHFSAQQQQQQLWQQQQQMWQQLGPGEEGGVNLGLCSSSSALVVCSGHNATYVVPVYKVREH
jgi:actin-related protein